jgi:hypothetical protein
MVSFALRRAAALALMAAAMSWLPACSSGGDTTTVTAPSTSPTTEMFTGTVPVGGSDSHTFAIALSNGQVNVILTQAGPPSTIYEGLGIGTPSGSTCSVLTGGAVVTPAGATAQLSGTAAAGSYCIVVYDVGNQTNDITYSVTVTHY